MLQIVLLILGGIVVLMGLVVLARGEFKLSSSRTLEGGQARLAGLGIIALGLAVMAFAWWGLPHSGSFRFGIG